MAPLMTMCEGAHSMTPDDAGRTVSELLEEPA
jgi:hypothetical protein